MKTDIEIIRDECARLKKPVDSFGCKNCELWDGLYSCCMLAYKPELRRSEL